MDGLSRALGAGPTIKLCDRTLTVRGRILGSHAEIEAEILKQRLSYLREIKNTFADDKDVLREVIREAVSGIKEASFVSLSEMSEWLSDTFRGYCFMVWQCTKHNANDLTLDFVTDLIIRDQEEMVKLGGDEARRKKREEIEAAIDQASGEDDLGNSTGRGDAAQTDETAEPLGD